MTTILIVEDEIKLACVIRDYLHKAEFQTHMIHDGKDVCRWVKENHVDLILLDLMLPNKDGLTICKELRAFTQTPVIMVTAKIDEIDRLLGLEIGADDYICKPFSTREVVARVHSLLRRKQWSKQKGQHIVDFSIDENRFIITVHGEEIELTAIELNILKALIHASGSILSRQQLIDKSYSDYRVVSDRTIDSHIKKLRRKLNNTTAQKDYIHSVYGVGYRFELPDNAEK